MAQANCAICLDTFNRPTVCIPCGHIYCAACIRQWCLTGVGPLGYRIPGTYCPNCRQKIKSLQKLVLDNDTIVTRGPAGGNGDLSLNQNVAEDFPNHVTLFAGDGQMPNMAEYIEDHLNYFLLQFRNISRWTTDYIHDQLMNMPLPYPEMSLRVMLQWTRDTAVSSVQTVRQLPGLMWSFWNLAAVEAKLVIITLLVSAICLILQNVKNPFGLWQSFLLPTFHVIGLIILDIFDLLGYILIRPFLGFMKILIEIGLTVCDLILMFGLKVFSVLNNLSKVPYLAARVVFFWLSSGVKFFTDVLFMFMRLTVLLGVFVVPIFLLITERDRQQIVNDVILRAQMWRDYFRLPRAETERQD